MPQDHASTGVKDYLSADLDFPPGPLESDVPFSEAGYHYKVFGLASVIEPPV